MQPCECGGREHYQFSCKVRREATRGRAQIDVLVSDDHLVGSGSVDGVEKAVATEFVEISGEFVVVYQFKENRLGFW